MRMSFAATACLLLLAGCGGKAVRAVLSPADVLHRSVIASNTLDSFSYAMGATFRVSGKGNVQAMSGALHLTGSLLRERTIATGLGFVDVLSSDGTGSIALRIQGAYAMVPRQRPAIRVDSISTVSGAVMLERDAGSKWISLPFDDTPSPLEPAASIDQRWIALQTAAMHVTNDLGLAHEGGKDVYHYQVALNVQALETMFGPEQNSQLRETLQNTLKGELWIDADNFLLQRASWSLKGLQTERGAVDVRVTVMIFDQNQAGAAVTPPMPDQIEYPDDRIFATIFSGALLPFLSR